MPQQNAKTHLHRFKLSAMRCALLCSLLLHAGIALTGFERSAPAAPLLLVQLQPVAVPSSSQAPLTPLAPAPAVKTVRHRQAAPVKAVVAVAPTLKSANEAVQVADPTEFAATQATSSDKSNSDKLNSDKTSGDKTSGDKTSSGAQKTTEAGVAYGQNPRPVMPYLSRQRGESGAVKLRVKVGTHGEPLHVAIVKSSGFERLDQAAKKTVAEQWRFTPKRIDEIAVEGEVEFSIQFKLLAAEE
mgnify:CR=1 FL=1